MSEPGVIFCIGATKAGTSWLYDYLARHKDCSFRSIKELHYFDALDFGTMERQIETHRQARDRIIAGANSEGSPKFVNEMRKAAERSEWIEVLEQGEDLAAYKDFISRERSHQRWVGDITPAYSLISKKRLRQMAGIGGDVRFIFLMRDPVSRLWSHVRMLAVRRGDGVMDAGRANRILRRVFRGEEPQVTSRGDYKRTLRRVSKAVDRRQCHFAFYEDIFDGAGLEQLCEFLGIEVVPANLTKRVHEGQPLAMEADQRRDARAWLADQYEGVQEIMGRVPDRWQREFAEV